MHDRKDDKKMKIAPILWGVLGGMLALLPVQAAELSGFTVAELRLHTENPRKKGQRKGLGFSFAFEPEIFHIFDNGDEVAFKPFARFDVQDSKRTHFDIREAYWLRSRDVYEALVGVNKVFWGVMESNHLVDIINQTDGVEGVDGEEKLGQPMVQFSSMRDWGRLSAFILPGFRERTFAGQRGRLRGSTPVATEMARYDSAAKHRRIDAAVRYEHTFDDWDIGLAHFSGTSREPVLERGTNKFGDDVLIPIYNIIDQTSIDLQYTTDAWLLKLEAMTRDGQDERFAAISTGFEYTFFNVKDLGSDIGILLEYHRDDRGKSAPAISLDDDLFFGMRLAMNDTQDTQLLTGLIKDLNHDAVSYFIEASRRLNDHYTIEIEARFFTGTENSFALALEPDDFILLSLTRYF